MKRPVDIVELRLSHLRATAASERGWYHVAVQHYLYCLEAACGAGDGKAEEFFSARLAGCYRAMGMAEKASRYEGRIA